MIGQRALSKTGRAEGRGSGAEARISGRGRPGMRVALRARHCAYWWEQGILQGI
jgi:hypothetical protein